MSDLGDYMDWIREAYPEVFMLRGNVDGTLVEGRTLEDVHVALARLGDIPRISVFDRQGVCVGWASSVAWAATIEVRSRLGE